MKMEEIMTTEDLKIQSDRILNELNYHEVMRSGSGNSLYYSYNNHSDLGSQFYPSINTFIDEHGNAYMSLQNLLPMGIFLKTDRIQFNHPRLRNYINKMRRYYMLINEEEITNTELNKI